MQNVQRDIPGRYRERLTPPLWVFVAAALTGPMAALVVVPIDPSASLAAGVLVSAAVIAALVAISPVITVENGVLRAGRAHIDVVWLGVPSEFSGTAARAQRGPDLDLRSWHLIRGGIDPLVVVPITDPDDPAPSWVISTRTPDRLSAAIVRAAATPRTPDRQARTRRRGAAATGA